MRHVALLMRQWPQSRHAMLAQWCETRLLVPGAAIDDTFFRTFNQDVTILCSSFLDDVSDALIDALPGLSLVAHFGVWRGQAARLTERNIRLTDSGAAGADEAADFALTQLLAIRRRLTQPLLEAGSKRTLDQGLAESVADLRLGLVGVDAVAIELARRCNALGMTVRAWSPQQAGVGTGIEFGATIEELAADCDALSVHGTGDGPVMTAEVLTHCHPRTVIVSQSDPRLIDENALIAALEAYRMGGAALDVCHDEQRLVACPNTLVTPRLATNTMRARLAMAERVLANIRAFVDGEPLPDEVVQSERV
jgi:glyoxylate reductase